MMASDACMLGMAGMGVVSLLLIVLLVLGVAALTKYLFSRNKGDRDARKNAKGDYEYHSGT